MKKIISIGIVILGIVLGLYLGLWVMFVGGILGIAQAVDTGTITAMIVAWNLIKIVLASFVGYIIIFVSIILGRLIED